MSNKKKLIVEILVFIGTLLFLGVFYNNIISEKSLENNIIDKPKENIEELEKKEDIDKNMQESQKVENVQEYEEETKVDNQEHQKTEDIVENIQETDVVENIEADKNENASAKENSEEVKNEVIEIMSEQFKAEVIEYQGVVIVDFFATWCMPCKILSPILETIAYEENIKVVKVDIDKNNELANEYNIRSIPTMIIFKDDEMIQSIIGVRTKEEILKNIEN